MKTCIRIGWLVLALGFAGLVTGCVSQSSSHRRQPANDFEVVETSTKRELTTREMAYLRAKVAAYLTQQGQTGSGDYYVKIYLGEDEGVQEGDWVVVRFTRYPSAQFSLLASYPTTTYPGYPHYNYDYLPFGWFGFSALSFRYYDDPYYYGSAGYYPRWTHPRYTGNWRDRDRKPDHRHDRDRDKDRDRDHNRPRHDYNDRPSGALKPSFVPSHTDRTRWSNRDQDNRPSFNGRRRENRENRDNRDPEQPRNENRPHWRDRQANNPNHTGTPAPTNNFNPVNTPSVVAPPARPATRSDFHRERSTSETGRIARPQNSTGQRMSGGRERSYTPGTTSAPSSIRPTHTAEAPRPQPQPTYTPPAARSESRAESRSDNSSRTNVNDGGRRAREP
jgi:hypothetical protein